ncbi:MAG: hypothetical protein U1F52_06010 [Burkholderiales bacterium]
MRTTAKLRLALLALAALSGTGQAFEYGGLGLGIDPATLRDRFPESKHEIWQRGSGSIARPEDGDGRFDQWLKEGDGLYIIKLAPNDSRADVTAVSISLDKGKVRRWVLSFERAGVGSKPEQVEKRYPGCKRVLDTIVEHYGEPVAFTKRVEEGVEHRTRSWSGAEGRVLLDCGRYEKRTPIYAIDLEITPPQ